MPTRGGARRRPHDERGVAAVFIGIMLSLVLVMVAAFAVDLGMQRAARRDMQALADVVALDLSRELDGRTVAALTPDVQAAMTRSVARNSSTLGVAPTMGFELGEMVDGLFRPMTGAQVPKAVKVTAGTRVDFAFAGVTGDESGGAARSAVAQAEERACYRLGSYIASLDTAQGTLLNPLLGGLLSSTLNLDLVSYKGLAAANVSLLDLVKVGGLGVGTVDELLALDEVRVGDLYLATAKVLTQQGKLAQAQLLQSIPIAANTPTIAIGDLITAADGSSSALDATLNVLDIVTGSAFLAHKAADPDNPSYAVDIPNLGISLPGLANVSTSLTVIESPRTTCGAKGTTNETAQVRLRITGTIPAKSINATILGIGATVSLDATQVTFNLDLGQAMAELLAVHCSASGPDWIKVGLDSSVIGGITLKASLGAHATVGVTGGSLLTQVLGLLGLGSLLNPPSIQLDTGLQVVAVGGSGGNYSKDVTVPIPGGYDVPAGSGSGVILGATTANVSGTTQMVIKYGLLGNQSKAVLNADALYGSVLNPILSSVASSLNPLLTSLQQALITPLSKMLGLQVGGADVFAVRAPKCKGVRLVG